MRHTGLHMIDAIYGLERSESEWLDGLAGVVERSLGGGLGSTAITYAAHQSDLELETIVMRPGVVTPDEVAQTVASAPGPTFRRVFSDGPQVATVSAALRHTRDEKHLEHFLGHHDIRDLVHVNATDGKGRGLLVGCPLPSPRGLTRDELTRWSRLSAHLGSALRLRRMLRASPEGGPAAVFDGQGRCLHADPSVRDDPVLPLLRQYVLRVQALRRTNSVEHPLDLWPALIEGRWSLLDSFTRDGRQLFVAVANPAPGAPLRSLSPLETQVVQGVARGLSDKEIGYELGVQTGTVASCVKQARRKLGLRQRTHLGVVAKLAHHAVRIRPENGSPDLALLETTTRAPPTLTSGEVAVLDMLSQGLNNRQIAVERDSSPRTVANQVASILKKMGVASRYEAALQSAELPAPGSRGSGHADD